MSGVWYNLSGSSNILRPTYIDGFMDVSQIFITRADASMAGNVYVSGNLNAYTIVEAGIINQYSSTPLNTYNLYAGGSTNLDTTAGGNFYVAGDTSLNSTLYVSSDASFNRRVFIAGDLSMNGNKYVDKNKINNANLITKNLTTLNSGILVNNDSSMNTRLYVGGDTSFNRNLYINKSFISNGDISFNNTKLFVVYDASFNSKLFNASDTSFNSSLYVGSDASFGGRLYVVKDASLGNNLIIGSNVQIGGPTSTHSMLGNTTAKNIIINTATITIPANKSIGGIETAAGTRGLVIGNITVAADLSMNNRLYVGGDASFTSRLFVIGDASLNSKLFMNKDSSFNKNVYVAGNLLVNGNINVKQYTALSSIYSVTYALIIAEDLSVNGRLYSTSDASINNRFFLQQDASINGNVYGVGLLKPIIMTDISANTRLYLQKDMSLNSRLFINGDVSLNSRFFVGKDASLNNNMYVAIKTTCSGDLSLNSRLFVGGDLSINYRLFFNGDTSMNRRLFLAKDASFGNRLYVVNDISLNGNINIGGNIAIGGGTGGASTHSVLGNTTIGNSIINGNSTVNNNETITGISYCVGGIVVGNLTVKPDASFNGRLLVAGDVSFNARMFTSGDVSMNGKLFLGSDASFSNRLYVAGDCSINGNLIATYKANSIPLSAIIAPYYTNANAIAIDISTNRRLFVASDTSMNGNLFAKNNAYFGVSGSQFNVDMSGTIKLSGQIAGGLTLPDTTQVISATPVLDLSNSFGRNWVQVGASLNYQSIAMSANGQYQSTTANAVGIYTSSNYGVTWSLYSNAISWEAIAMSANGKYQTATLVGAATNNLYTSSNYGQSWSLNATSVTNGLYYGKVVAVSATGQYQSACSTNGQIFISSNYGSTWTGVGTARTWYSIAMSATGQYQTAVVNPTGYIYISNNYGVTWYQSSSISGNWGYVGMSATGQYQTSNIGSQIYVSSNYGNNWTAAGTVTNMHGISISADGRLQVVAGQSANIYISTNYGYNWSPVGIPSLAYNDIAISANGQYITAVVSTGYIYTSTTPIMDMQVTTDTSFNRCLFLSGDASLNGNLYVKGAYVGIGQTAPTYALDISSASIAPFRVGLGATNALVVTASGYVGIGTTSVSNLLNNQLQLYSPSASGAPYPSIAMSYGTAAADSKHWTFGPIGERFCGSIYNDALTASAQWINVNRNANTISNVNFPTGPIGVGTATPSVSYALDVNGIFRQTNGTITKTGYCLLSCASGQSFTVVTAGTKDIVWSNTYSTGTYTPFQSRISLQSTALTGTATALANSAILIQDIGVYMVMCRLNWASGSTNLTCVQLWSYLSAGGATAWVNCGNSEQVQLWTTGNDLALYTMINITTANSYFKVTCNLITGYTGTTVNDNITWNTDINVSKLMITKVG